MGDHRITRLNRRGIECFCGWTIEIVGTISRCRCAILERLTKDYRGHRDEVLQAKAAAPGGARPE